MKHLAIIMDGNRRFAKKNGLTKREGHEAGIQNLKELLKEAFEKHDIYIVSVYALSKENLKRDPKEVKNLYELLSKYLEELKNEELIHKNRIQIKIIGSTQKLPASIQKLIKETEEVTAKYKSHRLNIALAYSGQQEIKDGLYNLSPGKYTPVDALLRTGGDNRISNFLLYHIAYAEIFFEQKLFPEFKPKDLNQLIDQFKKRERRFGK